MTDDDTKDLTTDEKLDRILERLAALESHSSGTPRPLLDRIAQEVVETRDRLLEEIATLRGEFNVITADITALRARGARGERRLSELEQRPN